MAKFKVKKLWVVVSIIFILVVVTAVAVRASKGANQGVLVETAAVTKGDIVVKVPANGVLAEVQKKLVYYEGNAKVEAIEVELGQQVTEGQLLAVVDSAIESKLGIAKEQLEMDKISQAKLEKARLDAIEDSKRALTDARLSLDRSRELLDKGAISQVEFDNTLKSFEDADKNYQQYLKNEDSLYFDIQKMVKQINIASLNVKDLLEENEKQGAEIVSPMDGIVTQKNIELGGFTNPTNPSFVISNLEDLEIKINVSEYDIAKVKVGQEVEVLSDAMGDKIFKGTVESIAPVASRVNNGQSTETVVGVTIKVLETHELLKPGFTVKTRIVSNKKENTIIVPFDAIQTESNGAKFVYVVKDSIAGKRDIQLGIESDFNVEVLNNLTEGEEIIVSPPATLKDGDKVVVKPK